MPKRPALDDEWDLHKDVIVDLYVSQGKSLSEVMTAMAAQGFKRTKARYERAFKSWGISKNISKSEWTLIVRRLQEREILKKRTDIRVRGMLVPLSKIQKQRRLYESSSIFDRIRLDTSALQQQSVPLDIAIFTPAASPSPFTEDSSMLPSPLDDHTILQLTLRAPWNRFQDFLLSSASTKLEVPKVTHFLRDRPASSELQTDSKRREHNVMIIPHVPESEAHPVLHDPASYLPSTDSESKEVRTAGGTAVLALSQGMSGINLLQLIVASMSNNFEVPRMGSIVMDLIENSEYRDTLESALRRDLDTSNALAEKLLHPAAQSGRQSLVKLLLDLGVGVNLRVQTMVGADPMTALELAVCQDNRSLVKLLLERGATDWNASLWSPSFSHITSCQGTIFDLALERGHSYLFGEILGFMSSNPGRFPEVTLCTLRNAVLLGRTEVVKILWHSRPQLIESAKLVPWIFFEAALLCETVQEVNPLVNALCEMGLNMTAMSDTGKGSALAAASRTPNTAMISRLLAANAPIYSVAMGHDCVGTGTNCCCKAYKHKFCDIKGFNALHVAIENGHYALVWLLLSRGAAVQQGCGTYPIQLAAAKGNLYMIELLIQNGADVNATFSERDDDAHPPHPALSALRTALSNDHFEAARLLYRAGGTLSIGEVEDCDGFSVHTLLPFIAKYGTQDFVLRAFRCRAHDTRVVLPYLPVLVKRFGADIADDFVVAVPRPSAHDARPSSNSMRAIWDYEEILQAVNSSPIFRPAIWKMPRLLLAEASEFPSQRLTGVLLLATRTNSVTLVEELLSIGANPFERISANTEPINARLDREYGLTGGESAFRESVTLCAWELTQMVVTQQRRMQWRGGIQQTCEAFSHALCEGLVLLERMLLAQGISWKGVDQCLGPQYVESSLQAALANFILARNYPEMTRILRYSHCCKNLINLQERLEEKTPLQYLALHNQSEHVRTFLDLGAEVNAEAGPVQGATAFQFAAMNGNFKVADMLIKAGADVNAPPAATGGRSAIEGAAEWGRLDMVHYLLEIGADINDQRNYRRTVFRAWKQGHHTIARMVYNYRLEKLGTERCETPESIMATITKAELHANTSDMSNL
ncbi:hypothetical protein HBI82_124370 [Parastagonospora nodorum]|nr:hypothetical protein HBI74_120520 [Parastagonospora nodorum]KAH5258376.1 hypothetical protein HBI71_118920 [Parastagonospora nodorum]KAH5304442.1 hypothetical protein HBI50_189140 [Parastagonospora nodorum]KAH5383402.1 hypothetical protein HBI33_120800 [Parastagonospora nodorum]KAH5469936.1 hypothetical protein HBI28_168980 [Parastagonospora nodorum]